MTVKHEVTLHIHASADEVRAMKTALAHLLILGDKTMSVISEFAAKQDAFNARINVGIAGVSSDIQGLNMKIEALQASPGPISADDQDLLNDFQASGEALSAKVEALDALTPPAPPVG